MENITLQVHLDGHWRDAMRLNFDAPADGLRSRCSAACHSLARWADPDASFERLRADARQLLALPDLLHELGLPEATWQAPTISLNRLKATLRRWGLL